MSSGERRSSGKEKVTAIATTLIASVALAGCHDNDGSVSERPSVIAEPSGAKASPATLIFDALGGGSSVIRVYPGVTETLHDKTANGTFNAGESVSAECKTKGRTVHSDPNVGEEDRTSNEWVRIDGTPKEIQFATAVYAKNPQILLEQLPEC